GGDFHDVTAGASTGSPGYAAGPGYDLVTGRGTPVANLVVAGLVAYGAAATGPVASVLDGTTMIPNGGADSFGTTAVGTPVTRTFTVSNPGTQTLTLSGPISLPAGFSLASTFGSTALAPGASTTFKVRLDAATAGSSSGTLSFATNDPNDNPYAFTVSG